jgi:hypothetical protein
VARTINPDVAVLLQVMMQTGIPRAKRSGSGAAT